MKILEIEEERLKIRQWLRNERARDKNREKLPSLFGKAL